MDSFGRESKNNKNRREFLKNGMVAGAATLGTSLIASGAPCLAEQEKERSGKLSRGDAAILRFLAAAEILETDLWVQYHELGGIQDNEVPGGSGSPLYTAALQVLDGDMSQYIHDNTEDEFTHETFINAYLASKGADIIDLEPFRTLPGTIATGSSAKRRLTNLMKLTVDTSWWTRYSEPRFRGHISSGGSEPGSWATSGNPQKRCRLEPVQSSKRLRIPRDFISPPSSNEALVSIHRWLSV